MYEIPVAPSLRPPGTLLKRLRNINRNAYTQFKYVSRNPRVPTQKKGKKTIDMWSQNLIRWLVLASESSKNILVKKYPNYEFI